MRTHLTVGTAAVAILAFTLLPAAAFAGSTTSDKGYSVSPCYKQCSPLLSAVTPKAEAKRVYRNCMALCTGKGWIECPGEIFVKPGRACPKP
jgi:hypothetical protein